MLELKSFRKMHIVAGGVEEIGPPFASPAKNKVLWRVVAVLLGVVGLICLTVALTHHHNTSNTTTNPHHSEVTDYKSLKAAVDMWVTDQIKAEREYGKISEWDTSKIIDMKHLFHKKATFNGNISKWDVSKVTRMEGMFEGASTFNRDLSKWDVTKVTHAYYMFKDATSFNRDVGAWAGAKDTKFKFTNVGAGDGVSMFKGALNMRYPITATELMKLLPHATATDKAALCAGVPALPDDCSKCDKVTALVKASTPEAIKAFRTAVKDAGGLGFTEAADGECECVATGWGPDDRTQEHSYSLSKIHPGTCAKAFVPTQQNHDLKSAVKAGAAADWTDDATDSNIEGWHVGEITDMSFLFCSKTAEGDALKQQYGDVAAHVALHNAAKAKCDANNKDFDINISEWDVSKVTDMRFMFDGAAAFNRDISGWDVNPEVKLDNAFRGMVAMSYPLSGYKPDKWEAVLKDHKYCKDVPRLSDDCRGCDATKHFAKDTKKGSITNGQCVCDTGYKYHTDALGENKPGCVFAPTRIIDLRTAVKAYVKETALKKPTSIAKYGDIKHWYITKMTDLSNLLVPTGCDEGVGTITCNDALDVAERFNEEIGAWDTSNVVNMGGMLRGAKAFDKKISDWDTSKVTNMERMFAQAAVFKQDINTKGEKDKPSSAWDVSKVTNMNYMFQDAKAFKTDLSKWDVKKVKKMNGMFAGATAFEGTGLNSWETPELDDMGGTFKDTLNFNKDISSWDVSKVTFMKETFMKAITFDQDLSKWATRLKKVTNMESMFEGAIAFNQDVSKWELDSLTNANGMFTMNDIDAGGNLVADSLRSKFNNNGKPLTWVAPNLEDTGYMFAKAAAFNADMTGFPYTNIATALHMFESARIFEGKGLDTWKIGASLGYASEMFQGATAFDKDLSKWKPEGLKNGQGMFMDAIKFKGVGLASWNLKALVTAEQMFQGAKAFNQDLANWELPLLTNANSMFKSATSMTYAFPSNENLAGRWSKIPKKDFICQDVPAFSAAKDQCSTCTTNTHTDVFNAESEPFQCCYTGGGGGWTLPTSGDNRGKCVCLVDNKAGKTDADGKCVKA